MLVRRDVTAVIDEVRAEPKYRPLLRPIGAFLDSLDATQLMLVECEDAFIWRCVPREDPGALLYGVISHSDVPELAQSFKSKRLGRIDESTEPLLSSGVCPHGYEELLRCLSAKLDKECVTTVLVVEDERSLLVQYTLPVPLYVQMEPERMVVGNYFHEDFYSRSDIAAMIAEMRSHRGSRYYR